MGRRFQVDATDIKNSVQWKISTIIKLEVHVLYVGGCDVVDSGVRVGGDVLLLHHGSVSATEANIYVTTLSTYLSSVAELLMARLPPLDWCRRMPKMGGAGAGRGGHRGRGPNVKLVIAAINHANTSLSSLRLTPHIWDVLRRGKGRIVHGGQDHLEAAAS